MKTADIIKTVATAPSGTFVGEAVGEMRVFRGIKYATADRWEYPQLIESYDGEYDATRFGTCCWQLRAFEEDAVCCPFYHKEFRDGAAYEYGEDCLYLNIYAPMQGENLPVAVYIHGGSFTGGCAHENMISGEGLAGRNVIFVSLNYRLGPYGFASHPDLAQNGACGNFGLFDQLTALKWVQKNIAGFGGDPEKVTIVGQSAGAMSVSEHCLSPMSEGLFRAAVMMSGAGAFKGPVAPRTPEQTRSFWDKICAEAGVSDMAALRSVDAKTLYYAWLHVKQKNPLSILCTAPVLDGKLVARLPAETIKAGAQKNIPYLIGITANDMLPVFLRGFAADWMNTQKRAGMAPCYGYFFDRALPGDDCGAWHAADMMYMFETLKTNWRPYTEDDYVLSCKMGDMLAAFAKTGDPGCESLPIWEPWQIMRLSESCEISKWPAGRLLKNTLIRKGPM